MNTKKLNVQALLTAQQGNSFNFEGKCAVVIDVFRATSVIITALQNGATAIYPVLTPHDALQQRELLKNKIVLGGERNAEKIEGFDLGNSPLEYNHKAVNQSQIVITTTNGTVAFNAAQNATTTIAAAFINIKAISNFLLKQTNDIVFVCAGTNGNFSLEDGLCAGAIATELKRNCDFYADDATLILMNGWESAKLKYHFGLGNSYHYNVLKSKNYFDDLVYCLNLSTIDIVPIMQNGKITR